MFTHGLFMRAVAWTLLTGIITPGHDQMRSFRPFADRYPIPNADAIELRRVGYGTPSCSTIHLPPP
jgi:2,3-bisphosphoglycerate-dependent phosphoglycerate mutase